MSKEKEIQKITNILDLLTLEEFEDVMKYIINKYGKILNKRKLIKFIQKKNMDINKIKFLFEMWDIIDGLNEDQLNDVLDFLFQVYQSKYT